MNNFTDDIENCVTELSRSGTILYPTDTVWGLGCDATNRDAVDKVYTIKKRDHSKSLIVLVSDLDMLSKHVLVNKNIEAVLNKYSDKPTTIIYKESCGIAENVCADDKSVAIRICNFAYTKSIIEIFGKPIISTSANISGNPTPSFYSEIDQAILEKVNYTSIHEQDKKIPAVPSRLIEINIDGSVKIIRY